MPQPDDKVTAALEEIRQRSERPLGPSAMALPISSPAVRGLLESAGDVPRLLAAVDAALKHHQPRQLYQMLTGAPAAPACEHGEDYDGDAHFEADDSYWYCRDKPTIKVCISCTDESDGDLWAEWPCPTYSDISAALLGEEKSGA